MTLSERAAQADRIFLKTAKQAAHRLETPMGDTHPTPAENTSPLSQMLEGRPGNVEGDIDQRMASLLKDHQEMGARPKQEPANTDLYPATLPLSQNHPPKAKAASTDDAPKKATRKKATKKA